MKQSISPKAGPGSAVGGKRKRTPSSFAEVRARRTLAPLAVAAVFVFLAAVVAAVV
jgi:hypothetical protein